MGPYRTKERRVLIMSTRDNIRAAFKDELKARIYKKSREINNIGIDIRPNTKVAVVVDVVADIIFDMKQQIRELEKRPDILTI